MKLTDQETLELNELCNALVDGVLTGAQKQRLEKILASSEAARCFYVRAIGLSASLFSYASEMQLEAPERKSQPNIIRVASWWLGSLAAAALLVLTLWLSFKPARPVPLSVVKTEELVARVTGLKDSRWGTSTAPAQAGDYLRKGQVLQLAAGYAEITFDSGARVLLEGPAILELGSAWDATLRSGTLKASVPPEAIGFQVNNPQVNIVDLGTEFTMIADGSGSADVLVLKGEVEASPRDAADERKIVLSEKQSRHFTSSGVSKVRNSAERFARISQPPSLDPFSPATSYVHWSFDETTGDLFEADAFDAPLQANAARLERGPRDAGDKIHPEGRWNKCLRFDGQPFARAPLPGMSGSSPHTVSFWVRISDDAQLSSAYAMVAWSAGNRRLGSHPVHVGWNRNPTEGTVGVLRTDYGGGFALGATPLRDGRWHHVAVVFVPDEQGATVAEVKQYVDGRLEGEGKPSPPGTAVSTRENQDYARNVADIVWLGCRLGSNGQRKERFRGEMDELCVANRALAPREIIQLMKENRPLTSEMVKNP
ncbi:MAG TPA: LamG-like jellyroll fold domain-containing protein [Candidatus Dormibacteraeota bacterium]|nr:LamG-like jellyroll fold domain-containing protein [Candidatus Dormibacteraeota bacterium]